MMVCINVHNVDAMTGNLKRKLKVASELRNQTIATLR